MSSACRIAHALTMVLVSPLFAQPALPAGESLEEEDSPVLPPITRVLVRVEKMRPGSKFWLKNRNGDVRVMGWDKEEMHLTAEIRDTDRRRIDLKIQPKDGGVDVETLFQEPLWSFDWGVVLSPRCEMTVFVPRKVLGYFRTTNGSLFVSYVDGYAHCDSVNGDIEVRDISGEVRATTKNGSIEGKDLEARLRASTTNGQMRLANITGGVNVETMNGNILAKNLNGLGEGLTLTTANGSIDLSVGQATGDLTAESADGTLDLRLPDADVLALSKQSVHLRLPGRNQKIVLRTTNGSITLRE